MNTDIVWYNTAFSVELPYLAKLFYLGLYTLIGIFYFFLLFFFVSTKISQGLKTKEPIPMFIGTNVEETNK